MENFSHRGKDVEFWHITGEVIGSDKYKETHVSSSCGGGNISGSITGGYGSVSGHISAPNIHSEVITNHEFWIKTEDGLEKDVKLYNRDIPLRVGQKVTLIWATRKGRSNSPYTILVNHSANKHWFIIKAGRLNQLLEIELITGKPLLIGGAITVAIAWGITYLTDSWALGLGAAGIFIVYKFVTKAKKIISLVNRLEQHLENLAQFAYKNY